MIFNKSINRSVKITLESSKQTNGFGVYNLSRSVLKLSS